MKKIPALFISALLIAILSACGNTNTVPEDPKKTTPPGTASSESTSEAVSSPDPEDPEDLTTNSPLDPPTPPLIEIDPTEEPDEWILLSEKVEKQVKQAYLDLFLKPEIAEATPDDVMLRYYGTYGGAVAVMLTDRFSSYTMAEWSETNQNITIYYSDGRYITVWKDGAFYRLQEAYDNSILTAENIAQIATIQNENKVADR